MSLTDRYPLVVTYPNGLTPPKLNWRERRKLRRLLREHAKAGMEMNRLMDYRKSRQQQIMELVGPNIDSVRIPDENGFAVFADESLTWNEATLVEAMQIDPNEYRGVLYWKEVEMKIRIRFSSPSTLAKVMIKVREFVQNMNGTINDDSICQSLVVNDAQLQLLCKQSQLPYPFSARTATKSIRWHARPKKVRNRSIPS